MPPHEHPARSAARPLLFTPLRLREVTLPNRIVLAPMCQYSAVHGCAGDWHLVHLGKFALGGMGVVMTEAAAVEERGRITHGDLGIWSDQHVAGLRRITEFIRSSGAVPAIQIAHAGRKGSWQRPWQGHAPLGEADAAQGEAPWAIVGPTDEPFSAGAMAPHALDRRGIAKLVDHFAAAARRADAAGFDILEIHGGHGYLLASFLSPVANSRTDAYGGDLGGRIRFVVEVAAAVRASWPEHKPLFFRLSIVDGAQGGWNAEDSIVLATELRAAGVDVVDCSSGGVRESGTLANTHRGPGYQVHYAREIRRRCGIPAMAVGLIVDGHQAEAILQAGDADLVAIGRQALFDPYWAHHAALALDADPQYAGWAVQSGWWLDKRARALASAGIALPPGGGAAA
jgi:2,4-dienoyl-CoA reductase-like NADH-dependent reductase (Old Yellow Enzyme family)